MQGKCNATPLLHLLCTLPLLLIIHLLLLLCAIHLLPSSSSPGATSHPINPNLPTIAIVLGTRPEMIKLAPIIQLLRSNHSVNTLVISTGQHHAMMQQSLMGWNLSIDHDLNILQHNQSLSDLFISAITACHSLFRHLFPPTSESDRNRKLVVMVQGDTTTALAAATVSYLMGLPVAHVEAGLRTFDHHNPFPEEFNRRVIDMVASVHFTPTRFAEQVLIDVEGTCPVSIHTVGNTVVDAIRKMMTLRIPNYEFIDRSKVNVLVTSHRRENIGQPLVNICLAILQLLQRFRHLNVILPMHLNPNVRKIVKQYLSGQQSIHLIDPIPYHEFTQVMRGVQLIMTDSGGVMEEAVTLGIPCVLLRRVTERPEGIYEGTVHVTGQITVESIVEKTSRILEELSSKIPAGGRQERRLYHTFGDGHASERIVRIIYEKLSVGIDVPCVVNRQDEIAAKLGYLSN